MEKNKKVQTDFEPEPAPDPESPIDRASREGTDIHHSVGEYLHGFNDGAGWASEQFFKGVLIGALVLVGVRLIRNGISS